MARSTIVLPTAVIKNLPNFTSGIFRHQAVCLFSDSQSAHVCPLFLFWGDIGSFSHLFPPISKAWVYRDWNFLALCSLLLSCLTLWFFFHSSLLSSGLGLCLLTTFSILFIGFHLSWHLQIVVWREKNPFFHTNLFYLLLTLIMPPKGYNLST